jgi:hypothetical protein
VDLARNVSVGHLVMLHGCTIGENSLIGIGAIILNRVTVGTQLPHRRGIAHPPKARRSPTARSCSDRPARWCAAHARGDRHEHLDRAALRRALDDLPPGIEAHRMKRFQGALVVCTLLIAYASLYPFAPLRPPGDLLGAFFLKPRHIVSFDLWVNVLAYIPFGALACYHFRQRGHARPFMPALALSAALSLTLEVVPALHSHARRNHHRRGLE